MTMHLQGTEGGLRIRLSLHISTVINILLKIKNSRSNNLRNQKEGHTFAVVGGVGLISFNPANSCGETCNLGKYFIIMVHQHTAIGKLRSNS